MLCVNSCSAVYQLLQTEQAVQCTDSYMMTLGNCNGAVYLVDWLDGQCGQVGQVVGMLESSSQDDISNTG